MILFLVVALFGAAIAQNEKISDRQTQGQQGQRVTEELASDRNQQQSGKCGNGHVGCATDQAGSCGQEKKVLDETEDQLKDDVERKNKSEAVVRIMTNAGRADEGAAIEAEAKPIDYRIQQNAGRIVAVGRRTRSEAIARRCLRMLEDLETFVKKDNQWLRSVKAEMRSRVGKLEAAVRGRDGKLIKSQDLRDDIDIQKGWFIESGLVTTGPKDSVKVSTVAEKVDERMAEYGFRKGQGGKPVNVMAQIQEIWDNLSLIGGGILFLAVGLLLYAIILRRR